MQALTGTSKIPEKFQEEGWLDHKGPKTPSLEIILDTDIEKFKEKIIGPHYIIVYGNRMGAINSFRKYSGIELNIIK